jgi:hypothetical protein
MLQAVPAEPFRQRFMQARADVLRKRGRLGVAEDLDCLPRRVHNDAAVFAFSEVLLEFRASGSVKRVVEVIFQLPDKSLAIQFASLP